LSFKEAFTLAAEIWLKPRKSALRSPSAKADGNKKVVVEVCVAFGCQLKLTVIKESVVSSSSVNKADAD